ncbi:MAG: hypothetical protein IMW91_05645 [Firmicutes bacterium]|nr:hypothetical protein [Bacillota bacterium]
MAASALLSFRSETEVMHFLDPTQDFAPNERKTEIRYDPLTGRSSRILYYPFQLPPKREYTALAKQTKGERCPFCNVDRATPLFPGELNAQGRFTVGQAVTFPNLFPYAGHSAVTIFSAEHFVAPTSFTPGMIADALLASQAYLKAVRGLDKSVRAYSINWNYLPMAGGSILHPHLQVIAGGAQTNEQREIADRSALFYARYGKKYGEVLVEEERERVERYVGRRGEVDWLTAFAPQGQSEFLAFFTQQDVDFFALSRQAWLDFGEGLTRLLAYLDGQGYQAFNAALFIPADPASGESLQLRLLPRVTLGPLETSDINYFKVLHEEALSLRPPEAVAQEARSYFGS